MLLLASAKALITSQKHPDPMESFINTHTSYKRAPPSELIVYKHLILLHKIYNEKLPVTDWVELNFNQILTSRQTHF